MADQNAAIHETINDCISKLSKYGTLLSYPAHKEIACVGDMPDAVYIIKEGTVCTVRYTSSGNKKIFWNSWQAETSDPIFLTASVITRRPVTVDIIAETNVKLVRIPYDSLMEAMHSDPIIGTGLAIILASRFMDVKAQLHESEEASFEQRFYELLLKYADEYGEPYENKILIRIKLSQQFMADTLHVDRTTVARGIKKLKDDNLIERINDLYCIKNIKELQLLLDQVSDK